MTRASTGPGPTPAVPRWALWAAYVVPLCVLPSAVWRCTLPSGDEVSFADEGWYLLLLSHLSVGFAMLTLGLVHQWGERIPGRVPGPGGRTVPVRAAVIPAVRSCRCCWRWWATHSGASDCWWLPRRVSR